MYRLFFSTMFIIGMMTSLSAQFDFNLELLSNRDYAQNCNDIWAWTSDDNISYAILGTVTGTAILDISDMENPIEVQFIPGAQSVWRDMKSWGDYVYVTTDQGEDGLLIINMSGAPDSITWEYWQPELETNTSTGQLFRCHNLYIDENGYAYLAGCNINEGGPLIFDVHTTPGQPEYLSASDPRYSHDVYVRNDLMYSSDILDGIFSVIDVSDKSDPRTIATQQTGFRFTHNAWLSDDSNVLFTTDERPNAFVEAYDVSDLENIRFLDAYRPLATEGQGVIPHNVHVIDDYLVISYYTDGVKVVDASDPTNLIEVGSYDTYPFPPGGFNGCWGAYPWLPSGGILASDINSGLYVLEPTYVRAARIEGQVRDADNGQQLGSVFVNIESEQVAFTNSNNSGIYKTGIGTPGTFNVTFSRQGYHTEEIEVNFVNGETQIINIDLRPLQRYSVMVNVVDSETQNAIPFPSIKFDSDNSSETIEGDEQGQIILEAFEDDYNIIIGAWGYQYTVINESLNQNLMLTIELESGYEDHFVFDYGWTVDGDAEIGHWERGVPEATFLNGIIANPDSAFPDALGEKCYVTGAEAGSSVGEFDLDDGFTFLRTPLMDLSEYENPVLQYARWFFNGGGFTPLDDTLVVYLVTEDEEIELERVWGTTNGWSLSPQFKLQSYASLEAPVQIVFEASDLPGFGHIVEAAIDFFSITDEVQVSTEEKYIVQPEMAVFPNPVSGGEFYLRLSGANHLIGQKGQIKITGLNGTVIHFENTDILQSDIFIHSGRSLKAGMYFVELLTDDGTSFVKKLMVAQD